MTFANILTFFRLFSVPPIMAALLLNETLVALILITLSGVSDMLDGYVARVFKQETELGRVLDPIADKFLVITLFLTLAYLGDIPFWICALVLFRDFLIFSGIFYLKKLRRFVDFKPVWASKINTSFQILFIFCVVFQKVILLYFLNLVIDIILVMLVATTLLSTWRYYEIFRQTLKAQKVRQES